MTVMQAAASSGQASPVAALKALAGKAQGMTGADIERWVREARQKARRERRPLSYADLESQLLAAKAPRSMALRTRMAIHEAGHAVARLLLGFGPISEMSIEATKGGYVAGSVGQDEMTESWLTSVLIQTLAGRAAEEIILGTVSANSGGTDYSDLASATKLALEMETVLGLGRSQPLIYRQAAEIGGGLAADPELAARANERLERAYQAACTIVREQEAAVDFLAEQLFEAGTLDGPELDVVLAETRKRIRERPG